jgi:parallel beta-helix repeat protein
VSRDDISLIAEPRPGRPVVLESVGSQHNGIVFALPGSNNAQCLQDATRHIRSAKVSGFVVRNFTGSGIFLACVDGWAISSNTAQDNKLYGIFPVLSSGGWINRNVVTGAHDTGIYIGQSHDVHVNENVAHDNVSGFEVENSRDVEVDHNETFNNTAGILL